MVSEGFNTVTYRGTGANQSISGLGFQPDLLFLKSRSANYLHYRFDSVRGPTKRFTNTNGAESTTSTELISFDADGFTVGSDVGTNQSGGSMVAWAWEAGGAPTADNSAAANAEPTAGSAKIDGSNKSGAFSGSPNIAVTRLSANTARGFSIVTYTGSSNTSFPHGLSSAPKWVIIKQRSGTAQWAVYHTGLTSTSYYLNLDDTGAEASYGSAFISPGSDTVTIDASSSLLNANSSTYVAYCWTDISGYSSIGSYTGDGTTDGSKAITTGFRPSFVMMKNASASGTNWLMFDSTRDAQPTIGFELNANNNNVEGDNGRDVTFTNTGFTVAGNNNINGDGNTHVYMAFADTREAAFFKDVSTNGNHFTPVNLDYRDSVPDVPTNSFCTLNPLMGNSSHVHSEGNLKVNYGTAGWIGSQLSTMGMASGKHYWEVYLNSASGSVRALLGIESSANNYLNSTHIGNLANSVSIYSVGTNFYEGGSATTDSEWVIATGDVVMFAYDADNGTLWIGKDGTWWNSATSSEITAGTTTNAMVSGLDTSLTWLAGCTVRDGATVTFNFGQDSSFAGVHATANSNADGEGHGSFAFAPPSGYLALCSQNLPDVDIIDGTEYFNTVLYTGNGSTQNITGAGFQPDLVWGKERPNAESNWLFDSIRGATKQISSNSTNGEGTQSTMLTSFDSDGFTMGSDGAGNQSSTTYVSWNWKAGGAAPAQTYVVKVVSDSGNKYRFDDFGTSAVTLNLQEGGTYTFDQSDSSNSGHPLRFSTTSNGTHGGGSEYTTGVTTTGTPGSAGAKTVITVAASAATLYYYCSSHSGMGGQANTNATFGSTNLDGSILSTVSANTDAGFSIVSYTGTGSNATVGHGIATPDMIIAKRRDATENWPVYTAFTGSSQYAYLDHTNGFSSATSVWQGVDPTSSVFSIGTSLTVNSSGGTYIAYCFHSVEGYSKVGSYVGNGNAAGTFVYTGFRPSWIMIRSSGVGHWIIFDVTRHPTNVNDARIYANVNNAEDSSYSLDLLSNGFTPRHTGSDFNSSGVNYLYLAFAETPFKFANAR